MAVFDDTMDIGATIMQIGSVSSDHPALNIARSALAKTHRGLDADVHTDDILCEVATGTLGRV